MIAVLLLAALVATLAAGCIIGARLARTNHALNQLTATHWRNEDICDAADLATDGEPLTGAL